jgi:hypothetical protein
VLSASLGSIVATPRQTDTDPYFSTDAHEPRNATPLSLAVLDQVHSTYPPFLPMGHGNSVIITAVLKLQIKKTNCNVPTRNGIPTVQLNLLWLRNY